MIILAAIAGVAASTVIYSIENVVDRKVTTKIEEKRAEKLASQQQQAEAAAAPTQVYVPTTPEAPAQPSAREAALEAQLLQMQQAFAQLQAAQTAPAPAPAATEAPVAPTPTPAPAAEESVLKKGQTVSIVDTAEPLEGDLNTLLPPDKRVGRISKINPDDGTVRVNVPLGGKSGARAVTVSEYDVVPV